MKTQIVTLSRALDPVGAIEDFATVLAHIRTYGGGREVWEALDVGEADWGEAQVWTRRMAAAAFSGDSGLVDRFDTAFRDAMSRLRRAAEDATAPLEPTTPLAPQPSADERGPSALEASNEARLRAWSEVEAPGPFGSAPGGGSANREAASTDDEGRDPLGTTVSVEILRPEEALPFVAVPAMSVDQYASLSASLDAFPGKQSLICARYGIRSAAELELVHSAFRVYFARSSAAAAAFEARFVEVRARLLK